MHVPKKYFKMVRRYGLYSRDFNKRAKKIVSLWKYMKKRQLRLIVIKKKKRAITWRENIIKSFARDPLICNVGFVVRKWYYMRYGVQNTIFYIILNILMKKDDI